MTPFAAFILTDAALFGLLVCALVRGSTTQ